MVSAFDFDSEVKPEDSVSRVDSQVRSVGLHLSRLRGLQSWKRKRLCWRKGKFWRRESQEEARLNLDAEIAKSAAKGQALAGRFRPPDQLPVRMHD